MRILSGRLDRRIVIERANISLDETGGEVRDWKKLAECWAELTTPNTRRGDLQEAAGQLQAANLRHFAIRWRPVVADVNPKDRLIYQGLAHEILAVQEIGRRAGLLITAQAGAD